MITSTVIDLIGPYRILVISQMQVGILPQTFPFMYEGLACESMEERGVVTIEHFQYQSCFHASESNCRSSLSVLVS